jgi:nitroreductase
MTTLDLATVDRLLTTTRSVRKRLDLTRSVEPDVLQRCIAIALQAPTGSNGQGWHFMVVTHAETRARLAAIYRRGFEDLARIYTDGGLPYPVGDLRARQFGRMVESSAYLMEHLHEVPVIVVPCIEGRFETAGVAAQASLYGSIFPAVWSFILALRARGIGSCLTTDHLFYEAEAAQVLGIPETVTQVALLPVAYFTGEDFKPAKRLPAADRTHWNNWGTRR